jgi:hypothetical protein
MRNFKKLFTSVFCLVSLTAGMAKADNYTKGEEWSEWKHDDRVLPELYLRSRCTPDPANPKKAIWEIQFKDIGDALVEVRGKDFKYDIPSHDESAGSAQVATKSCSKMPELKIDGSVPSKGYGYKLTFKDGALTVKPHDHHKVDWGGWLTAGMMGAAEVTGTMAQNSAKMEEVRAQQQAQQQAAAQARALQLAQWQAAQLRAQAAAARQAQSGGVSSSLGNSSSESNPGSSSARGSGNNSNFVKPVPECVRQELENDLSFVHNLCNIKINVVFTSSGDISGALPLGPGERSRVYYSPEAARRVGGVELYACSGYGSPWLPDGSNQIGTHYNGPYTCSRP